jgi:hypothetical protein
MHGSIPLSDPAGGAYTSYAVTLPTGSLRLGWNTVEGTSINSPDFRPQRFALKRYKGGTKANK